MSKKSHESGVKQAQNELKHIQNEENRIATGMMGGREGGRFIGGTADNWTEGWSSQ